MTNQVCTRCIYDDTLSGIIFDPNGVCNYCHQHDEMCAVYPNGEEGEIRLQAIVDEMKRNGKGKKYDCVLGVSGGCDSSYLAHILKTKYGLRILAAHFDNTWNSEIATQNIYKVLDKLDIDLYTEVADNREIDDLFRAFILSDLKEVDAPTDIALARVLYNAAIKHKIGYIINGHSFRTEGVAPLGWVYVDGMLIKDVHKKYGTRKIKKFPNLTFWRFVRYAMKDIQRIRPLYFMNYDKPEAKRILNEAYGWEWYGGHHLENRFAAFNHLFVYARKAKLETRLWEHAALVRSGDMSREEAENNLKEERPYPTDLVDLVKKRLKFTDEEIENYRQRPTKIYTDYKTYKKRFELFKPFFWVMLKLNRVPKSFYDKFCASKKFDTKNE
jgi:N-acetyl sugar amidotransferase